MANGYIIFKSNSAKMREIVFVGESLPPNTILGAWCTKDVYLLHLGLGEGFSPAEEALAFDYYLPPLSDVEIAPVETSRYRAWEACIEKRPAGEAVLSLRNIVRSHKIELAKVAISLPADPHASPCRDKQLGLRLVNPIDE